MIWNSKTTTYYSRGKKAFVFGDPLPADVISKMGEGTLREYLAKGWIDDGKAAAEAKTVELKAKAEAESEAKAAAEKEAEAAAEAERNALLEKATGYGLKPHYRAEIAKLEEMVEDYEDLQALKTVALELGIDPSDDVDFAELTELIDEKKAEDELDSQE